MFNFFVKLSFLCFMVIFVGCANVTSQSKKNTTILDASQEDSIGGTGASSADIRSMAENMAREILSLNLHEGEVKIALSKISNQTRFHFDTDLLKNRLLADLVSKSFSTHSKKHVRFTTDSDHADYLLDGSITSLSKGSREAVSDYLLYTFQLVDKKGNILWMGTYETKKEGNVGVMYR